MRNKLSPCVKTDGQPGSRLILRGSLVPSAPPPHVGAKEETSVGLSPSIRLTQRASFLPQPRACQAGERCLEIIISGCRCGVASGCATIKVCNRRPGSLFIIVDSLGKTVECTRGLEGTGWSREKHGSSTEYYCKWWQTIRRVNTEDNRVCLNEWNRYCYITISRRIRRIGRSYRVRRTAESTKSTVDCFEYGGLTRVRRTALGTQDLYSTINTASSTKDCPRYGGLLRGLSGLPVRMTTEFTIHYPRLKIQWRCQLIWIWSESFMNTFDCMSIKCVMVVFDCHVMRHGCIWLHVMLLWLYVIAMSCIMVTFDCMSCVRVVFDCMPCVMVVFDCLPCVMVVFDCMSCVMVVFDCMPCVMVVFDCLPCVMVVFDCMSCVMVVFDCMSCVMVTIRLHVMRHGCIWLHVMRHGYHSIACHASWLYLIVMSFVSIIPIVWLSGEVTIVTTVKLLFKVVTWHGERGGNF